MTHYDGRDWRERWRKLKAEWDLLFEEEREDLGDLPGDTARIMQSYLHTYKRDDEAMKVIGTELDEWVDLPNGDKFNFIIDLAVQEPDGGIWLWDHKSSGSFMDPDYMLIEAQLARYFWAFPRLPEYAALAKNLKGVVFNEIRTKAPTVPEQLQSGQLTSRQNLDTDYYTYLKEIKRLKLPVADYEGTLKRLQQQTDKFFRRTPMPKDLPVVRAMMVELMRSSSQIKRAERKGEFNRTPDKSCVWGCSFSEPCVAQLHGADITEIVKHRYNVRKRKEEDPKKPKVTGERAHGSRPKPRAKNARSRSNKAGRERKHAARTSARRGER
jgi:hypothetical protein